MELLRLRDVPVLIPEVLQGVGRVEEAVREGRFQKWLSLITAASGVLSGLEVGYEHWRGSYSLRVMYTPVALSTGLAVAGVWGFRSQWAARVVLRGVSVLSLIDSVVGFYFHIRGVARKPGGWRLPLTNMIMGPPVFAPLLFGVAGYLGVIASYLRSGEEEHPRGLPAPTHRRHWAHLPGARHERIGWKQDIREGRFQKHMAAATCVAAFFSGFEAWYSHYKNNFKYWVQWTPVVIAPALMAASVGAIKSKRVAHTLLPAASALAILDGSVGYFYHARGVARRPGGLKKPLYNTIYGPPVFAPLLFAASGFLGLLASLFRREK